MEEKEPKSAALAVIPPQETWGQGSPARCRRGKPQPGMPVAVPTNLGFARSIADIAADRNSVSLSPPGRHWRLANVPSSAEQAHRRAATG